MKIEKIEFIAYLPPITSAITVSGLGEGARIKLDVPASEICAIIKMQLLTGKTFKVTIEEIEDRRYGRKKTETD